MGSSTLQTKASSWKRQSTGKTLSVVESIFGRELGFPGYSRCSESMSNSIPEKMIGRHMIKARTNNDVGSKQPKLTVLDRAPEIDKKANQREPQEWIRVPVRRCSKMTFIDNLFWEVKNEHGRQKSYTERFYELQPDPARGFRLLGEIKNEGVLKDFEVNYGRVFDGLTVSNSIYLYSLTDLGCLQAYDLSNRRQSTRLFLKSTLMEPVKFTDMQFDSNTGRIYVVATVSGFLKSIYTIKHPPWMIENIIHIKIPIRMEIFDSGGLLLNPSSIEILDLKSFDDLAEETHVLISESQKENTNCEFWPGVFEKELRKKPEVLEKVPVTNSFFGVLESIWPPMFYARRNDNIKIGRFDSKIPLWEFNTTMFSINAFIPMPDGSPHVLFLTDDDYKLLTLKRVDNGDKSFHEIATSQPFDIEEPRVAQIAPRENGRPLRRAAVESAKLTSHMSSNVNFKVLGLSYSEVMDLIAVFSCNHRDLHVMLYEGRTMKFFKRLPSVKVWPCPSPTNPRTTAICVDDEPSRREEITKMVFEFDFEYIYANVRYKHDCEVYCLRVMNERHH